MTRHLHSMSLTPHFGVSSPILLNHTTHNTKVVILVSLPRLESSLRYSSFGEFLLRSARRKIFTLTTNVYGWLFPIYNPRVLLRGETWRVPLSLCQLVSLKLRISPLLSGIVLSYYSHSPKFLSVKHGIERRITAQTEKLWILPTENHICNAQRTHSKTGSTLRLIYHSPHFTTAHRFLFLARRKKLPQMTIQLYLALYDYCRAAYHTRRFATSKTTY